MTKEHATLDVFYALSVHGTLGAGSFWHVVEKSFDATWQGIVEYIAVEIKWWCDDRGLEPDHAELDRAKLYRVDPETGVLAVTIAVTADERFAVLPADASPAHLAELFTRYQSVFADPPFAAFTML